MSNLMNPSSTVVRVKAIAMLEAWITQKYVARRLWKTIKTVNNWWRRNKRGESLIDKPRSGRPSSLTRVAKIVISKSVGKRHQSTRKLTKRLTIRGHMSSKTVVHRNLSESLASKATNDPANRDEQKNRRFTD